MLDILPPELRVTNEVGIDSRAKEAQGFFKNLGYTPIRIFYQMRISMDAQPPAPRFLDAIALRPFIPTRDLEAVYQTDVDSFRDHFGYVEEPFESGLQRFSHYMTKTENYDPSLWFIAWDGDEVAGISICRPRSFEDDNVGWVATQGMPRRWRKRGLGLALLQHSFGEFYKRGVRKVGLGVDAASQTGATRLYKRAGMRIGSEYVSYEKELRAGRSIEK